MMSFFDLLFMGETKTNFLLFTLKHLAYLPGVPDIQCDNLLGGVHLFVEGGIVTEQSIGLSLPPRCLGLLSKTPL